MLGSISRFSKQTNKNINNKKYLIPFLNGRLVFSELSTASDDGDSEESSLSPDTL